MAAAISVGLANKRFERAAINSQRAVRRDGGGRSTAGRYADKRR
jgi:hypothetical protein